LKLYKYQKKGVRQIDHFKGRALLADEMGLGKTVQALDWLKQHPDVRPVIIVCPASIKWIWEHHVALLLDTGSSVANGRTPPKGTNLHPPQITILNYDILPYWLDYLQTLSAKALLLDEGHYLKSLTTKRSKAAKTLSKKIPYIIGITGTPLTNRPSELWNILTILRPDLYKSLWSYRWRYCDPKKKPWGWEFNGASNLQELHANLKNTMMIRRLKKDVLTDLPEKTHNIIPVEIKRKEYQEATDNFLFWLATKSPAAAKRAKSAQRLVQLGQLKQLAVKYKMKSVTKWIEDFLEESNEKLVLFAIHKTTIQLLHKTFPASVVVDGSTSMHDRKLAVKAFQADPKIKIFIGNIQAAGTGITLTASSSVLFVELPWVPADLTQASDRVHRIGQTKGVMIYYIVAKNTIEEGLCAILQKKQKILSEILDGDVQKDELNIYDELERALKRRLK